MCTTVLTGIDVNQITVKSHCKNLATISSGHFHFLSFLKTAELLGNRRLSLTTDNYKTFCSSGNERQKLRESKHEHLSAGSLQLVWAE